MFFFLSKTIGFLLVPSNLLGLLFLSSLLMLWKRTFRVGRGLSIAGAVLLLFFWLVPAGSLLLALLENRFPACAPGEPPPAGMIVLGGVIDPVLSRARDQIALNGSAERLTVALGFAQKYPGAKLLLAGGNANLLNNRLREADFMVEFFTELGIAKDRIIVERESRDTAENALYAKRLAQPKTGERWLLITSAGHMPRAVGVFRKVGFDVVPCPVDYQTTRAPRLLRLPGGFFDEMRPLEAAVHEWVGLLAYRVAGKTTTLLPGP